MILSVATTFAQSSAYEVGTWKGFRSSAATFTFDDGCATQFTYAVPLFDKYKYTASFYPVISWGPNWSNFQSLVNKGHEVGSHSVNHGQTMPDSEISSSKNTIDQNISGQVCNTITYPNCNEPSESELAKYYIGGRICDGQVMGSTPSNYFRIGSVICGNTGSCNSASAFQNQMQSAINKKGWVVFLIHEVENGSEYSPTATSAIEGALSFASQNDSKVWVCTFRDAILYSKERNAAKITELTNTATEITMKITDDLANDPYKYPLSLRRVLPDGWSEITVSQDGEEIGSKTEGNYIYFDAVPDGGVVTISSGSAALSDPTFAISKPNSVQSWCSDSSYNVAWTMTGEATSTYTLNWNSGSSDAVSASSAKASSEWANEEGTFSWSVDNILTDDGAHGENSRWGAKENSDEWVELSLSKTSTVGGVIIDEFTEYGTVSSFSIEYDDNGTWKTAYEGTTIGNDFQATFAPVSTSKVRLFIKASSGININYFAVSGVSSLEIKDNISASGSYTWNIPSGITGSGTLTINKTSGKALATSAAITISSCGGSGSDPDPDPTPIIEGEYTGPSCDETGNGAYYTGVYRNLFSEYLGKSQTDVDSKIESIWSHFFGGGTNTVYYTVGNDMAYILDTGNSDVRTEGMSYGMMICVQLNHKEEFDKLWRWAQKYMQYKSGNQREGLFAWQCETNGTIKGSSCAPDGEAYFLTALFFASHRWGNDGEINYEKEAQYLIKMIMDKPGRANGTVSPIFNLDSKLITFGETSYGFTDPSYNLPGFLELWARWTDTNKDFWAQTAKAARDLLYKSSNSSTGLFPDYSQFDGSAYKPDWCGYESDQYKYDAIRCAMNVGMDYHWFEADSRQTTMMGNLLNFFKKDGYTNGYFTVNGSAQGGNYSEGMAGANGVGVFALNDETLAKEYVTKLWNTSAPSGQWRYYNGMVYFLSMLHASGTFKIYKPMPAVIDTTLIIEKDAVEFNGKSYSKETTFITCYNSNVYRVIIKNADTVSVTESKADEAITTAPNPACNYFDISCKSDIESVEIVGIDGRIVKKDMSGDKRISVSNLSKGSYMVKIILFDGKYQISKLVIAR